MMTQVKISGMTCGGCANTVKALLLNIADVTNVEVQYESGETIITASRTIMEKEIIEALKVIPTYQLVA